MLILPFLSAVLILLAFPPFNLWGLSYLFAIPLLYFIDQPTTLKRTLVAGFIFGAVYMLGFHAWILEIHTWGTWPITLILWIALSLFQALFYLLLFGLTHHFKRYLTLPVAFSVVWVFCEWARSLGTYGNTGGAVGYLQSEAIWMALPASALGIFGLSLICILINSSLYFIFFKKGASKIKQSLLLLALIGSIVGYDFQWLQNNTSQQDLNKHTVAIVQGNHTQNQKLTPSNWPIIKQDYLNLTRHLSTQDMIFWPETIVPVSIRKKDMLLSELAGFTSAHGNTVIFGSPIQKGNQHFNGLISASAGEINVSFYHKELLMPFGEYVPFETFLKRFPIKSLSHFASFSRGLAQEKPMIQSLHLGSGICLESIYPSFYRDKVRSGAKVLFVAVNNAWFHDSSAAKKHLQMSRMRAIENNRYMIQAANTGLSAVIGPYGELISLSKLNQRVILSGDIYTGYRDSLFTRFGHVPLVILIFILVLATRLLGSFFSSKTSNIL